MEYLKKALLWAIAIAAFLLGVFIAEVTGVEAAATEYCKIGADPANPGLLLEGEKIYKLPRDMPVKIKGGSGKISDCTLKAGEEVVVSETTTGSWRIVRIYSCGNPVLNEAYAEAPQGPRQALQPAPQEYGQLPAQQPTPSLSQSTNVMVQTPPPPPNQPPMNVSYYSYYGNGSNYRNNSYDNYDPNRVYDDYYNNQNYGNGYYNGGYGGGSRFMESMAGAALGTAIVNGFSRPPKTVINDSFNTNKIVVINNGRPQHGDHGNHRGGYDNYYSSRSNHTYRGATGGAESTRQNYTNQTVRSQSPRRR